jgi:zinc transport system ATP-binding protein
MSAPLVEVSGLTVHYGQVLALKDVSFALHRGEFVAVLGPNGSGKTTLFRCLMGLAQCGGTIHNRARRLGYVPQLKTFDRTFPGQAVEVVLSGIAGSWPAWIGANRRRQALQALERVGAADVADRPVGALSGGQLQRVYLARALVHHPDLLLLDEPAAGVDRVGEQDLYQLLEDYQHDHPDMAIIMITHDWEVARHHADTSLILNHRVVGFGPSAEVLTEECLRQAFGHMGHSHTLGPDHA